MKKYPVALLLSFVLLLSCIFFQASQKPDIVLAETSARDLTRAELWDLYAHNWLVVSDSSNLLSRTVVDGMTVSARHFDNVQTENEIYTIAGYTFTNAFSYNVLNLQRATLTINDNTQNYIFLFYFVKTGTPIIEHIPVTLLISSGVSFEEVNIRSFFPFDYTQYMCYGIDVFGNDHAKISGFDQIDWTDYPFISPVPFFGNSLYGLAGSSPLTQCIFPNRCIVYGEDSSLFYDCEYGVIIPQTFNISFAEDPVFVAAWSGLPDDMEIYIHYTQPYEAATETYYAIPLDPDTIDPYRDTISYINTTCQNHRNGRIVQPDSYIKVGIISNNAQSFSWEYTFNEFGVIMNSIRFGSTQNEDYGTWVERAALGVDLFHLAVLKVSETPSSDQPSTAQSIYANITAGFWTGIAAAILYPTVTLINVFGWIFTGGTWPIISYEDLFDNVIDPIYKWCYNASIALTNVLGSVFESIGKVVAGVVEWIQEELPKVVESGVSFLGQYWWVILIVAGVIGIIYLVFRFRNN